MIGNFHLLQEMDRVVMTVCLPGLPDTATINPLSSNLYLQLTALTCTTIGQFVAIIKLSSRHIHKYSINTRLSCSRQKVLSTFVHLSEISTTYARGPLITTNHKAVSSITEPEFIRSYIIKEAYHCRYQVFKSLPCYQICSFHFDLTFCIYTNYRAYQNDPDSARRVPELSDRLIKTHIYHITLIQEDSYRPSEYKHYSKYNHKKTTAYSTA